MEAEKSEYLDLAPDRFQITEISADKRYAIQLVYRWSMPDAHQVMADTVTRHPDDGQLSRENYERAIKAGTWKPAKACDSIMGTKGCTILRCSHYVNERCTHPGNVCKFRLNEPLSESDDLRGRLKIACDAMEEISDLPANSVYPSHSDIAFIALRRLSLNNPH
jgi:hypothetical protein